MVGIGEGKIIFGKGEIIRNGAARRTTGKISPAIGTVLVRGGYRFGARLSWMLRILCRNRVRDLGAQPFTDPGTDLQNQIQVAEFMPEIA